MDEDFDFSEFQINTLTFYSNVATIGANLGLVNNPTPTVKYSNWTCSLQSASSAQSAGEEKRLENDVLDILSVYVAYGSVVLPNLNVSDYAVDENGKEYELIRWDASGGVNNIVGSVFLIFLKAREG